MLWRLLIQLLPLSHIVSLYEDDDEKRTLLRVINFVGSFSLYFSEDEFESQVGVGVSFIPAEIYENAHKVAKFNIFIWCDRLTGFRFDILLWERYEFWFIFFVRDWLFLGSFFFEQTDRQESGYSDQFRARMMCWTYGVYYTLDLQNKLTLKQILSDRWPMSSWYKTCVVVQWATLSFSRWNFLAPGVYQARF